MGEIPLEDNLEDCVGNFTSVSPPAPSGLGIKEKPSIYNYLKICKKSINHLELRPALSVVVIRLHNRGAGEWC